MPRKDNEYAGLVRDGATRDEILRISEALHGSPLLNRQASEARIDANTLAKVGLLPAGTENTVAHYDIGSRTLRFDRNILAPDRHAIKPYEITHVFGHELWHATHRAENVRHDWEFETRTVQAFINEHPAPRDYTALVRDYSRYWRAQEAMAELNGANTVISGLEKRGAPVTAQRVAKEMLSFSSLADVKANKPALAPSLHLDPTTHRFNLDDPATIEAAARTHFDRNPGYRELEVQGALECIARAESRHAHQQGLPAIPAIRLDFAALGVTPEAMARHSYSVDYPAHQPPLSVESLHPRQGLGHPDFPVTLMRRGGLQHDAPPELAFGLQTESPARLPGRYASLQQELKSLLPEQTSPDRLAQISAAALQGGVRPGYISAIRATEDSLFIIGQGMGERARIDLTQPPPALEHSVQSAQLHIGQQAIQSQQIAQQVQQQAPGLAR